jgi:hypothetical protein
MLLPSGIATEIRLVTTERPCWGRLPANHEHDRIAACRACFMRSDLYKPPQRLQTPSHKPQLALSILPIATTTFVRPSTAETPCSSLSQRPSKCWTLTSHTHLPHAPAAAAAPTRTQAPTSLAGPSASPRSTVATTAPQAEPRPRRASTAAPAAATTPTFPSAQPLPRAPLSGSPLLKTPPCAPTAPAESAIPTLLLSLRPSQGISKLVPKIFELKIDANAKETGMGM